MREVSAHAQNDNCSGNICNRYLLSEYTSYNLEVANQLQPNLNLIPTGLLTQTSEIKLSSFSSSLNELDAILKE
jgi:hypothetical protein